MLAALSRVYLNPWVIRLSILSLLRTEIDKVTEIVDKLRGQSQAEKCHQFELRSKYSAGNLTNFLIGRFSLAKYSAVLVGS